MTEEELFEAARHIRDAADRAAYLERACAAYPALRPRVEALLRSYSGAGGFLEQPAAEQGTTGDDVAPGRRIDPADLPRLEGPGSRIGPYKLLQPLGEGGMGAVFLAEQQEPVQRRVALKIIKAGMDSARVIARFEAERQALAMMDHPNIAKVLDAGATDSGRPYFVMELVKGIPITKFCDQEHLTPKERLELFLPVCQAVQHAHQKGIIHRDLKPSNVLIALYDGKPVPKVIDFGVAKATAQKLTERTVFTEVGQIVGTLEYMAPEQAELNNLDIDTRADIYSLGVLLYELLTGAPPFTAKQLRGAAFTEMLRLIREVEPPRPSTKLSGSQELPSIAANRKLEPAKLAKLVRGDLDWIVMKCLEKDRGRRYETANGLASDVQRYLADEPVLASPPSVRYRLGKFVRKHRGPVLAASVILVLLVAGILGTSLGFVRAERHRQIAEENERTALDEKAKALASADAERLAKQNEAAERKKAEASQKHAMEALRATTDDVVEQLIGARPVLGPAEKAFLENTLKRWQAFAAEKGETEQARVVRAEGVYRVAKLRTELGQREDALAGFRKSIELHQKLADNFPAKLDHRENLAGSFLNLGTLLVDLGKPAEAERAFHDALDIAQKLADAFPAVPRYRRYLAASHNDLGTLLARQGRWREAEAALRHALDIQERLVADFPDVPLYRAHLAASRHNRGYRLGELGRYPEAEAAYRQSLTLMEKLVAEFPAVPQYRLDLADTYVNLGRLLQRSGKWEDAEAAYRRGLTLIQKLADDFPAVAQYRHEWARGLFNFGYLLAGMKDTARAEAAYRQALVLQKRLADEFPAVADHRHALASSHKSLGILLKQMERRPEAEASYREALALFQKLADDLPTVPQYRNELADCHNNLGNLLGDLGKRPEAEAALRQALALYEKLAVDFPAVPGYRIGLGGSQTNFGNLLRKNHQPEQALEWYARAIATLENVRKQLTSDITVQHALRNTYWSRAQAFDDLKRPAEADADWDRAVELTPVPERAGFRLNRAGCRVLAGRVDEGIKEVNELVKNADAGTLYDAACIFALAAHRQDKPGGAPSKEECANRAMELLQQAVAKGFKSAEHLKKDDDLKALRGRDDFKKLLAELGKKAP